MGRFLLYSTVEIEDFREVGMVTATEGSAVEREEETRQCGHYWLIDSPGGPTSKGVCRLCGIERQFRNYLENARWDEDGSSDQESVKASIASSLTGNDAQEDGG